MSTFRLPGKATLALQIVMACQQEISDFAGAVWLHDRFWIGDYAPELKEDLDPESFRASVTLRDGRQFWAEGRATEGVCGIWWRYREDDASPLSRVNFTFTVKDSAICVEMVKAETRL